ncbi:MAG: hypothetical protein ACK4TL_17890 [Hyphomicrobiaceae bacterium]
MIAVRASLATVIRLIEKYYRFFLILNNLAIIPLVDSAEFSAGSKVLAEAR